ncbi:MAG: hypothetical protein DKM50_05735 [Candidatus Margulisiibacteriota bacterium]|nr:MAG: hypothetical protein A2X43_09005 [Candidatus Margulisbacteria bacterium GWD2_39_127]OGI03564.1 MAG: hypothetical protein A2X42_00845 [Candidatus Margulisbacteria bacterium GWF2_38_17]OGI11069.1 MAG: hypothetical protein A2X41_02140 [Candidatus Margulisbacteria bacterium GWE2_39_32]PZM80179.1 MAG: hypothetical protein DKM50_05735 [Candidatus Margulisiibacteriota bacterium]HAR62337.1 hypothetical protein [Candidatus Margulisiibacteriota bacterium]
MGQKGTEVVDLDVQHLLYELNRAYADEWFAVYSYLHMARTVSGKGYEDMQELLEKIAEDEQEHVGELAERIAQLGGTPIIDIAKLGEFATRPYPHPPEVTSDYNAIVGVVKGAENAAIDHYNKLAAMTLGKDHVTYQLIVHIMSEEVNHEEMFENFLK